MTRKKGYSEDGEEKKEEGPSVEALSATPPETKEPLKGSSVRRDDDKEESSSSSSSSPSFPPFLTRAIRCVALDIPLIVLFLVMVSMHLLQQIHDEYLSKQIELMRFLPDNRQFTDTTYYHRVCDESDITATSTLDLLLDENATKEEAANHMLKHGASMYPNLLSKETADALREFIDRENKIQQGWYVIENEYRYSWGIDINMHPALKTYWKELASNRLLVEALEEIVGPDPAIIEFTAITSAYGAKDQFDHQDVVPPASATKFARSFVPSYSLFIPLQDTTYEMGATHVCSGSHLCSEGCEEYCPDHNLAMSGEDYWPQGWGALVNQQTTHKGMGHTDPNGLDRVVIIATFAPRPQLHKLERRMIAQGGSYSLLWSQWGHTFLDYVNADTRMREPFVTMRSLGLLKGRGWNLITVASGRIANEDTGYDQGTLQDFVEKGGYWFLPDSWQNMEADSWETFLADTLTRTREGVTQLYIWGLLVYVIFLVISIFRRNISDPKRRWRHFRSAFVMALIHFSILLLSYELQDHVNSTTWAKNIRNEKTFRLPPIQEDAFDPGSTLPTTSDILMTPNYSTDLMASYGRVLDVAHPGNAYWKSLIQYHSKGYETMPPAVKDQLCVSLARVAQDEGRFLVANPYREWTEIEDENVISFLCHRELLMASNPLKRVLLRTLDSVRAELVWGAFQSTIMYKKTMPEYLKDWERILEGTTNHKEAESETSPNPMKRNFRPAGRPFASKAPTTAAKLVSSRGLPDSLSQEPDDEEDLDFEITEGMVIEAMYNCRHQEWYRGVILEVFANSATFDVEYGDGDKDYNLSPACVRPFEPYEIDEEVEVRVDGEFYEGEVARVYDDDQFDIDTEELGLIRLVDPADIRRVEGHDNADLERGMRVKARFEKGTEWFHGKIHFVHSDGTTIDIVYDDGDFERDVDEDDYILIGR